MRGRFQASLNAPVRGQTNPWRVGRETARWVWGESGETTTALCGSLACGCNRAAMESGCRTRRPSGPLAAGALMDATCAPGG